MKRKRKSPRRHSVKSHVRNGYRVSSYVRGQGRTIPTLIRRKIIKTDEPKSYTINFQYSKKKGDGESVVVIAKNYQDALDEAFEEKTDSRNPISIEVIDPDIGKALRIIGKGVGKGIKLGAKYAWIAGKTITKETAHAIAKSYREMRLRRLIDEAYSPDRVTRIRARAKLKLRYPEIYSICDFSKEKVSTPAKKQAWVKRTKAYY